MIGVDEGLVEESDRQVMSGFVDGGVEKLQD